IAEAQAKLIERIYRENAMRALRNDPAALAERNAILDKNPEVRGKIGAILLPAVGDSYDQSAALRAILRAIEKRAGLTTIALGGRTIKQNDAHEFVLVRFANGSVAALDPAWHAPTDA